MADRLIYVDGEFYPWAEATVPVDSAGVKYGANVFEGICVYATKSDALNIFRLEDHLARLHQSLKLARIDSACSSSEFEATIVASLQTNGISQDAHIRLSVIVVGEGRFDVRGPTSLVCVVTKRPPSTLAGRSTSACVSSWRRIDDLTLPPRIKAGANYHNSRFAMLEAQAGGYDEAILLNGNGKVAEATASCVMIVRRGALVTPPVSAGLLESVTRDTMLQLADRKLGVPIEVRDIDRTELCTADEAFLCNSFEEVRPLVQVDRLKIGSGQVGEITQCLWNAYEEVVRGGIDPGLSDWLTPVRHAYSDVPDKV